MVGCGWVNRMYISIDYLGRSVGVVVNVYIFEVLCKFKGNWGKNKYFFCIKVMESVWGLVL